MEASSPFRCTRCGKFPYPSTINRTVLFQTPASRFPLQMLPRDSPPGQPEYIPLHDLCLSCTFDLELAQAWHILEVVGTSNARGGVWMLECMPGYEIGEEWADFSTLTFGRQIGMIAAPPHAHPFNTAHVPWAAHYRPTEGFIVVSQSWLRRVRYRDTPLYLEERWNPTVSELVPTMYGLRSGLPDSAVHEALRGRRLLQILSARGRPPGGRFGSPEECREAVIVAIEAALQEGRKPRREDVEFALLAVESQGKQLSRELEPYRWSDILAEVRKDNPDLW